MYSRNSDGPNRCPHAPTPPPRRATVACRLTHAVPKSPQRGLRCGHITCPPRVHILPHLGLILSQLLTSLDLTPSSSGWELRQASRVGVMPSDRSTWGQGGRGRCREDRHRMREAVRGGSQPNQHRITVSTTFDYHLRQSGRGGIEGCCEPTDMDLSHAMADGPSGGASQSAPRCVHGWQSVPVRAE